MLIFIIWQANTHIHANTELKDVKLWQVVLWPQTQSLIVSLELVFQDLWCSFEGFLVFGWDFYLSTKFVCCFQVFRIRGIVYWTHLWRLTFLVQVHTLLKGLEKIAASADIPMLVAGDFNSVPMRSVYIYILLLNSIQRFRLASVTPYIRRKALWDWDMFVGCRIECQKTKMHAYGLQGDS
jgi:hypothetical protein